MSTVFFLMQQLHKHEDNCYLMYVNRSREDMIPHKYTTYTVIYVIKFNIKKYSILSFITNDCSLYVECFTCSSYLYYQWWYNKNVLFRGYIIIYDLVVLYSIGTVVHIIPVIFLTCTVHSGRSNCTENDLWFL